MTATAGAAELADRIRNAYADAALQQARFGDGRRHRPFPNPAKTGAGRFPGPTIPVPAGPLHLVSALLPRLRPPPALSGVPASTTGSHITAPPAASACRQSRSEILAALAASTGTPSIPTSKNSSSERATKPTRAMGAAPSRSGRTSPKRSLCWGLSHQQLQYVIPRQAWVFSPARNAWEYLNGQDAAPDYYS